MAELTDPASDNEEAALQLPQEAGTMPSPAGAATGVEFSPLGGEPPTPPANEAVADETPGPRRFHVGTLSYTAGGLALLFVLLLGGDFALSMRDRAVGPAVQLMLKRLNTSSTMMAFLLSVLPPMLSMLIQPVVSYKSDRLRSRWGRRIPYLLVPAPIAAASMVLISYSEALGPVLHRGLGLLHLPARHLPTTDTCALLCFGVAWTLFECAALTAAAVVNALINDVVPRAWLGRFYGFFRAVSLIAGMIFNYWLFGYADTHYQLIFGGLALLFLVGFGVMCLTVREGEYPPPAPVVPGDSAARRFGNAVNSYMRECFSHAYYRWVFVAMMMAGCTFLPINLFSVLYAKALYLKLHPLATPKEAGDFFGARMTLTYAISLGLSWPLGWLVDRTHALRVSLIVMAVYGVSMVGAWFFLSDRSTLPFSIALVVHGVLSGCYFTTASPLGQALFPRLSYGQYASAAGLVSAVATMILSLGVGEMLDHTGSNYALTFIVSGAIGLGAFACLCVVHVYFLRFGGKAGYQPPNEVHDATAYPTIRAS